MRRFAYAMMAWLLLCSIVVGGTTATYPAYDTSADASTWYYGLTGPTLAGGGVGNYTPNNTTPMWSCWTMPLTLQPGTYYLTQVGVLAAFTLEAEIGNVYFCLLEDDAGALTPVTFDDGSTYVDMTADVVHLNGVGADIGPTTVASVPFTLVAGKTYHLAWALQRGATPVAQHPGICLMKNGQGPQGLTTYATHSLASFPIAHTGTAQTTGELPRGFIKFTTPQRTLISTSYDSAKDIIVPYCSSHHYCIKFTDAVAADGQALTVVMDYDNSANDGERTTYVLDMGATNQQTFGGASVALDASEAGDTFHNLFEFRTDDKADLFYMNMTTGQGPVGAGDFTTISHACKNDAADDDSRGQEYAVDAPQYLKMTGTAAVTTIEVGWQPMILFGDSQLSRSSHRLGEHLPTAGTYDHIWWQASIAGNKFTSDSLASTAGYLRYKSVTPGVGDLCEIQGGIFVIASYGINDLVQIGTTEAYRNRYVMQAGEKFSGILYDLQLRGLLCLIVGLPPYSKAPDASAQEAAAVQQFNAMLEGMAVASRAAYVNPWSAMCASGTASDDIPTFASVYTGDAGLHYNSAGAALVASQAMRALETNIVGGWWSSPWRRLSRRKGSLWPL